MKIILLAFSSLVLFSCASSPSAPETKLVVLTEVAHSDTAQWTGITVSKEGRIFVNYPRWSPEVPISVGELRDQKVEPFPDKSWNSWKAGKSPKNRFVCVQSVVIDADNYLWVVDAASPNMKSVVPKGAKLVKFDLSTKKPLKTYLFDEKTAPKNSYLNDVRIDTKRGFAYLTDSGAGAIVVVDLKSGKSWRALASHPSTKSENITLTIEGKEWKMPDGSVNQVHADGIELDAAGDTLYYQALSGNTMYQIKTELLRNPAASEEERGKAVEVFAHAGPADGLLMYGGNVYLGALQENAVKKLEASGKDSIVVQDPKLAWPDTFAVGPDQFIYVTTSQIHRGPKPSEPYRIFKFHP